MVISAIAAFTALVAVVVLIAGPELMQLAFSNKFSYDRGGLLLVTLGMGLYLSSVTINQACVAQGQVRRAAVALDRVRGLLHRVVRAAGDLGRVPAGRDRVRRSPPACC